MLLKQKSELAFKKKHEPFIMYTALTLIVGYAVFLLISTQTEISQKQSQYDKLHEELVELQEINEQLERYTEESHRNEYMEQIARDKLDYAHPLERIYYIIPTT